MSTRPVTWRGARGIAPAPGEPEFDIDPARMGLRAAVVAALLAVGAAVVWLDSLFA